MNPTNNIRTIPDRFGNIRKPGVGPFLTFVLGTWVRSGSPPFLGLTRFLPPPRHPTIPPPITRSARCPSTTTARFRDSELRATRAARWRSTLPFRRMRRLGLRTTTRRTFLALAPAAILAGPRQSLVQELPTPAGPESGQYRLVGLPDGGAFLTWLDPGLDRALYWSRFDGRAWSRPQVIVRSPDLLINWADFPSLCPLGGGRFAAHWLVRHKVARFATSLRVGHSRDGGRTWRNVFQSGESLIDDYSGFVSLAPTPGGFGAVYLAPPAEATDSHGHDSNKTLRWADFDLDGSLLSDREIDARVCSCCQTSAVIAGGGPLVAYRDHAGEIRDIAVLRRVGGAWTKPRPLHDDGWRINACPVNGPALAARGDRVAAAWFTGAKDLPRVHVAFSSNAGRTFDPPVRIDLGRPVGRASIALLKDDTAVAGWIEKSEGGANHLKLRRARADGRRSAVLDVAEVGAARAGGFPSVVPCDDKVLVAWRTGRVQTAVVPVPPLA